MTSRSILSVRLDEETAAALEHAARSEGRPASDLVREALRAKLMPLGRVPPRPIDVVGDRVGCADSGSSDLSTRASELVKERLRARHAHSR